MGSTEDTKGPNGTLVDFTTFQNIIDGSLHGSTEIHQGINPSNGKPLWDVPIASADDLNVAVAAAQRAFKTWSKTKWEDRQEILGKIAAEFGKYQEQMGELLMLEGGKPIQFAKIEAWAAGEGLRYCASEGPFADEVLEDDENLRLTMRHTPIGIVGAICPWNFPLAIAMNKIAPALLTGSCIIVKPSPFTPYSVLKFAEIAQAFLPPGVLQAMNGDAKLGPLMTEHPDIAKISFTGSSATGKRVMASAAKTLKRVTLELGGNSASIICPDVDVNKIAPKVALGAFYNSGQLCIASKRLYVHKDIYQDMMKALIEVVKGWKVGPTSEEGLMLGPVQNEMQHNIVKGFFEDCATNGYEFALPGEVGKSDGFVIQPAILDNPPDESKIVREEQFGPIVPMMKWDNEAELLARVNDTNTGLGGAVWSSDLEQAQRIAKQIEAGTIWINNNEMPLSRAYFSGHKESGIGGEGGRLGLLAYMNTQVIHMYKSDVGRS
ncbi:ALDH-like protein [Venustampulla echinocandica]|uniref:aldehyde dehydrogenase (NAD(+)) n=1 Tax=Venustampulla echinocandica TaxID=2656787 RepID=A0A370TKH9_9HELO|nr:ALDH-like protein [Venustampulla echinocandica]RDL36030.1 ALDH-like protein [Venustampulla echinocandica]